MTTPGSYQFQNLDQPPPNTSIRVVFLGSGAIAIPSLQWLLAQKSIQLTAVITQPDKPAGRHLRPTPSPVKAACTPSINLLQPSRLTQPEFITTLRNLQADIFIVMAYGKILPLEILKIPPLGCINLHASILPRHRGASPIQAAILAGDTFTGITVMWMDEGLDTGDILLTREIPILETDTFGSLHERLAQIAPDALDEAIRLIIAGNPSRRPQDHSQATTTKKIQRSDGWLDWSQSAIQLVRQIRAYHPWPGSFSLLPDGRRMIIHRAQIGTPLNLPPGTIDPKQNNSISVATSDASLNLLEVQLEGGKKLTATEFLKGHPKIIGQKFQSPQKNIPKNYFFNYISKINYFR